MSTEMSNINNRCLLCYSHIARKSVELLPKVGIILDNDDAQTCFAFSKLNQVHGSGSTMTHLKSVQAVVFLDDRHICSLDDHHKQQFSHLGMLLMP
jgi:hypothetical protein